MADKSTNSRLKKQGLKIIAVYIHVYTYTCALTRGLF